MTTACVIIDVQGKILSVMNDPAQTSENLVKLLTGVQTLGIPTILLEQYPDGLGPTDEAIRKHRLVHIKARHLLPHFKQLTV